MERIYAPWRTQYVTNSDKKIDGCVFCHVAQSDRVCDQDLGVLHKEDDFFIVMNKYPYSPGHFMIIPNLHTSNLEDLDPNTFAQMSLYAQKGVKMLKEVLGAHGVNMGMNLGSAGGAGIAEHIHLHLVPRWSGDTNFITTVAHTRVYSTDFDTIYKKLKDESANYFK
ncbi:MAG: HIT domain-containing protein [Campylobacterales bacterium]|nr:HIT domain-containing protein [Campylobacterales bacterium]